MTKLTGRRLAQLDYVARHETPEYGVIIPAVTAESFTRLDLVTRAPRRPFARLTGTCVMTTPEGRKLLNGR
jgi:hypothetical protein